MSVPFNKCFKLLSSSLRIEIILALQKKEMSVTELSKAVGEERSKVSHALRALKDCSFVKSRKQGREQVYCLTKSVLNDVKVKGNIFEVIKEHTKHCNRRSCN